jgi:hypothetical protein
MPPAFNLSQDQTLKFNPKNSRNLTISASTTISSEHSGTPEHSPKSSTHTYRLFIFLKNRCNNSQRRGAHSTQLKNPVKLGVENKSNSTPTRHESSGKYNTSRLAPSPPASVSRGAAAREAEL